MPWSARKVERSRPSALRGPGIAAGVLGLALAAMLLLPACSSQPASSQGMKMRAAAVPITAAQAVEKSVPLLVTAIGNVEAYSTVNVKSQVEGELQRVYFKQGEDVSKGETLFSIDPRPFQAALAQAEGNLARDQALQKNAKAQSERYGKLYEQGIVSKDQYDQFMTNAESYDATVRADQAAVEKAQLDLGYCTIRAPQEGRTGSLLVYAGNLIKANADTPMLVINQIQPIYVTFSVPESYLSEIKEYQARSALRVESSPPNDTRPPEIGRLSFIDNQVDATTGTIKLKATFQNPRKRLWPGQFVNVVLNLATQSAVTVVPSQAVQTGQKGQYVYIVKPDLTVEYRPVSVGSTMAGETVIAKGVQPGETVVTDGQLRLQPGAKVQIKSTGAAAEGSSS
jgi:multidrug efflux system membrane fusion protein